MRAGETLYLSASAGISSIATASLWPSFQNKRFYFAQTDFSLRGMNGEVTISTFDSLKADFL